MDSGLLAFMELFVVLAFAIGWGVLELITLRMDKRKREREDAQQRQSECDRPV